MIVIPINRTLNRRVQITVCKEATLGSWGSHQLLLYEYRNMEADGRWNQMIFNYKFLKDKELDYGPLWCVYCGKEELKIYHWREKPYFHNMATADHLIPKSKAPQLTKERSNLRVACWRCNNRKADKFWEERFPYD